MSSPKTSRTMPAGRALRPGTKFLILLVGLFLMQVQLPIGGLLTALAMAATHPVGLGIGAAVTAVYLYSTRSPRR